MKTAPNTPSVAALFFLPDYRCRCKAVAETQAHTNATKEQFRFSERALPGKVISSAAEAFTSPSA